jgi:uncharacterized coiled-coil DUF342 family protein
MPENIINTIQEIKTKLAEINNIIKDTKLADMYDALEILSVALNAVISRDKRPFTLQMDYTERSINITVKGLYITSIEISGNTTIQEIYEKIFNSDEIKQRIIEKIYEKISELAETLSWRANIIEKLKYIEQEIAAIETRLDP